MTGTNLHHDTNSVATNVNWIAGSTTGNSIENPPPPCYGAIWPPKAAGKFVVFSSNFQSKWSKSGDFGHFSDNSLLVTAPPTTGGIFARIPSDISGIPRVYLPLLPRRAKQGDKPVNPNRDFHKGAKQGGNKPEAGTNPRNTTDSYPDCIDIGTV